MVLTGWTFRKVKYKNKNTLLLIWLVSEVKDYFKPLTFYQFLNTPNTNICKATSSQSNQLLHLSSLPSL